MENFELLQTDRMLREGKWITSARFFLGTKLHTVSFVRDLHLRFGLMAASLNHTMMFMVNETVIYTKKLNLGLGSGEGSFELEGIIGQFRYSSFWFIGTKYYLRFGDEVLIDKYCAI